MLSLATAAASLMLLLPVRIRASMVRRMFPFSTLNQFFAVGTNQVRRAARSLTLFPSRFVAFGTFPFAWRAFSDAVLVKAAIQSVAAALLAPMGTARSDPPANPGIGSPFVWLRIPDRFVTFLYLSPTQQLNQDEPIIDATWPWA